LQGLREILVQPHVAFEKGSLSLSLSLSLFSVCLSLFPPSPRPRLSSPADHGSKRTSRKDAAVRDDNGAEGAAVLGPDLGGPLGSNEGSYQVETLDPLCRAECGETRHRRYRVQTFQHPSKYLQHMEEA
jgi:hypothetical protein